MKCNRDEILFIVRRQQRPTVFGKATADPKFRVTRCRFVIIPDTFIFNKRNLTDPNVLGYRN